MGGRSLDDSDDEEDSEDEDRDPRLQRLLPRNFAFYNTKTSTYILVFACIKNAEFVKVQITFHNYICVVKCLLESLKQFGRCGIVKCSVDRKTALQEFGLNVTKLDLLSSQNHVFIVHSWKKTCT